MVSEPEYAVADRRTASLLGKCHVEQLSKATIDTLLALQARDEAFQVADDIAESVREKLRKSDKQIGLVLKVCQRSMIEVLFPLRLPSTKHARWIQVARVLVVDDRVMASTQKEQVAKTVPIRDLFVPRGPPGTAPTICVTIPTNTGRSCSTTTTGSEQPGA